MATTAAPERQGLACPCFMARAEGWPADGITKRCNQGFDNMSKVHDHLKNVHFNTDKNPLGHIHDQQMQSDVKAWFGSKHRKMHKETKWIKIYQVLFPLATLPPTTYYKTIIEVNDDNRNNRIEFGLYENPPGPDALDYDFTL